MNWIRQDKRLAIYLRDGLACAYCGAAVEEGTSLTLDHIRPRERGGTHHETNLVTCCFKCNSSRSDRGLRGWVRAVAVYRNHGVTADEIIRHVERCRNRSLTKFRSQAREMVERRGSAAKVLARLVKKQTGRANR